MDMSTWIHSTTLTTICEALGEHRVCGSIAIDTARRKERGRVDAVEAVIQVRLE